MYLPIATWLTGLLSRALLLPVLHPWRDPHCRVSSDNMRVEPSLVHFYGGNWTGVRTHTSIQLSKAKMLPLPLIPLDHSKFRENGSQRPPNRTFQISWNTALHNPLLIQAPKPSYSLDRTAFAYPHFRSGFDLGYCTPSSQTEGLSGVVPIPLYPCRYPTIGVC